VGVLVGTERFEGDSSAGQQGGGRKKRLGPTESPGRNNLAKNFEKSPGPSNQCQKGDGEKRPLVGKEKGGVEKG